MFTLNDALQLPIFNTSKLVAGKNGITKQVARVHIVDMPDATYSWAKGGELLLTAGAGLYNAPDRQQAIIPRLAAKQLSGLVLSVGFYFDTTPDIMCNAANRLDFPIIEMPPDINFVDVTEVIFTQLIDREHALRSRAAQIHQRLTELVLEGGSLQAVALTLAGILRRSITIESAAFDVLATAQEGEVDAARTRSIEMGRTAPDVAAHLLERGIYDQLLKERKPLRLPPMPDLDMEMERIVAPIIVAREIIGYVWIIAGESPLNDLDELAIEHAATVAALIMFKERALQDMEMRLRGDFLSSLLNSAETPYSRLSEQAHQFYFNLTGYYQVLLIQSHRPAGKGYTSFYRQVESWLQDKHPALVAKRDRRVVVILQGRRETNGHKIAHALVDKFEHPAEHILVGVGRIVEAINDLSSSYQQAAEALEVALSLGQLTGVIDFDQLGVLHWLRHIPEHIRKENIYLDYVQRLHQYDQNHNTEFLETLEAYLGSGYAVADAAGQLSIHRNTLSYRLDRISELLSLNLNNADIRVNLQIALTSYRLNSYP